MQLDYVPSIKDLLDDAVKKHGDKTFIQFIENDKLEKKSYRTVKQDSEAVCRWIRHFSTDKMHIAIISKTSYEYITCMTGILISGCTVVPFAPEISVDEAADLFKRADIDMLIYEEEFKEKADELQTKCPFIKKAAAISQSDSFRKIYTEYSDTSPYAYLSDIKVDMDDCAIIIFTSGTTGIRKGVMLSTRSIVANNISNEIEFDDNDSALSVLPMYHVFCFSGDYIKNLREGIVLSLNGNIRDIGKNLLIFEPSMMRIVPMIAQSLLQKMNMLSAKNPEIPKKDVTKLVFGKNIKIIYSGGAYLNPELAKSYDEYGIVLRQGYGMTEAGCRVSVPTEKTSIESVGKVISVCDIRIKNGEIQLDTASKMIGYYKMPQETKEAFTSDGWLKTGDIGYVTDDRELFITGRLKNLIILSSGENVSPEAIEKKFSASPLVNEVIIFGEGNRLVAEVHPDYQFAQLNGIENIEKALEETVDTMNLTAKPSHVISELRVSKEPLEKTSTGKIKRKSYSI